MHKNDKKLIQDLHSLRTRLGGGGDGPAIIERAIRRLEAMATPAEVAEKVWDALVKMKQERYPWLPKADAHAVTAAERRGFENCIGEIKQIIYVTTANNLNEAVPFPGAEPLTHNHMESQS